MRRLLRLVVVGALAFVGAAILVIQAEIPQASAAGIEEGRFVELINRTRADLGLPAYRLHSAVQTKAAQWAESMAASGSLAHSDLSTGVAADWLRLGENVGAGGAVEALHAAFLASPTHRHNLVHPGFSYLGVGVVKTGGVIFVAQEFMELQPSLPDLVSAPVAALSAVLSPILSPVLDPLLGPSPPPVSAPPTTVVAPPPPAPTPVAPQPSPAPPTVAQPPAPEPPGPPIAAAAAADPAVALEPTPPEPLAPAVPAISLPDLEVPVGPLVVAIADPNTVGAEAPPSAASEPTPAESIGSVVLIRASSSPVPPTSSWAILASLLPYSLLVAVGLGYRRVSSDL
ncbi:MAG: CAP domain-containing protein [Acidimicrobiia bacterium]